MSLGARTDLGRVRENNEDKFEFFEPGDEETLAIKGRLYAVADGMGGHAAGQIASELALKTVISSYYQDSSPMIEESLRAAVQHANALIFETARAIPERSGMGTTLTALILRGNEAFVAQVGDSRCYRLRDNKIEQITEDHSWINEQVKRGGMSEEEAALSPFKNVITRSLGVAPNVEVDIFSLDLKKNDKFLLCSDGLSNLVHMDEMREAMLNCSPSQAVWKLADIALERGGHDNVTVMIVSVDELETENRKKPPQGAGINIWQGLTDSGVFLDQHHWKISDNKRDCPLK